MEERYGRPWELKQEDLAVSKLWMLSQMDDRGMARWRVREHPLQGPRGGKTRVLFQEMREGWCVWGL